MTHYDFKDCLCERFSLKEAVQIDIVNELKYYNETDIDHLWNYFNRSYDKVSAPTFGVICKFITDLGIKKEWNGGIRVDRVYRCSDCKTYYALVTKPLDAYNCPNCLSFNRTVSEKKDNMRVFYIQDCCTIAWETMNNMPAVSKTSKCKNLGTKRSYGPMCKDYGRDKNNESCTDCICKVCCANAKEINKNY